jgi:hypothetical protein
MMHSQSTAKNAKLRERIQYADSVHGRNGKTQKGKWSFGLTTGVVGAHRRPRGKFRRSAFQPSISVRFRPCRGQISLHCFCRFGSRSTENVVSWFSHIIKYIYFQLRILYREHGSPGLLGQKPGPKRNYVRTDEVVRQVIRHRFLEPDATVEVIAQKLRQAGLSVSTRSVVRIFEEYGLQKKLAPKNRC